MLRTLPQNNDIYCIVLFRKMFRFMLFGLLTLLACIFHLLGTYFYKLFDKGDNFFWVFIISIVFGAMASIIRVPTNKYLGQNLSVVFMETFYLFLLFVTMTLYSVFIVKEKVFLHTYVIAGFIVGLLMLNDYLSSVLRT